MKEISLAKMQVSIKFEENKIYPVGQLAIKEGQIFFEYDTALLSSGLEISPFYLKLKPGVFQFDRHLFEGLPGVFNDSLPDGWGRLLFDRMMRKKGVFPQQLSALDRLAYVGEKGMGALIYEPSHAHDVLADKIDFDNIANEAKHVLLGEAEDAVENLLHLNGSSAGARPKALISLDQKRLKIGHEDDSNLPEQWIIKFPNTLDGLDAGAIEYVYSLMARAAGVETPETHLFPSKNGPGFFATKRFDRVRGGKRLHQHTACGLLHSDFRTPALDYEDLLALTEQLTRDIREVQKMYRLAVFNVLAHNKDDHSKNFSYLMDSTGKWVLAPAYDLTFSQGPMGQQSTMVMGEGSHPEVKDLKKLGQTSGLSQSFILEVIDQTCEALRCWQPLARNHGISKTSIIAIEKILTQASKQ